MIFLFFSAKINVVKKGMKQMKHAKYEVTAFNTKKMLSNSLKELVKDKPFSNITVTELTASCGLNRNTFYYHFDDINDLLRWTLDQEALGVMKNFARMLDYEEAVEFAIDYITENNAFLSNIYYSIGFNELKRFFYHDFQEINSALLQKLEKEMDLFVPEDYKDFLCHFLTEALAGMVLDGITTPSLRDKEKVTKYVTAIIRQYLPSILAMYDPKHSLAIPE